jgi:GNAT superfamily N-acetyltransferase
MNITFRTEPRGTDIESIREIVVSTGFFYDHEVIVATELIETRLNDGISSGYHFVFADDGEKTVAYSCFGHDEMTKSCFDLYWLVTHSDYRGKGIGKLVLEETYKVARNLGCTMIIAETSGRDHYIPTRAFYVSAGYELEGTIRDYYDKGDDKCIYVKRLD